MEPSCGSADSVVIPAVSVQAMPDRVSALMPEYPGWMFERQGEYRRQQLAESGRR